MTTNPAKSSSLISTDGVVRANSDDGADGDLLYSNEEKTKVDRKWLMWWGIGLGAAIAIPLFIYFAPHFL